MFLKGFFNQDRKYLEESIDHSTKNVNIPLLSQGPTYDKMNLMEVYEEKVFSLVDKSAMMSIGFKVSKG